jgi:hypothetical protein
VNIDGFIRCDPVWPSEGRCEHCRRPHGCLVFPLGDGPSGDEEAATWRNGRGRALSLLTQSLAPEDNGILTTKVVLATAHLDHDPSFKLVFIGTNAARGWLMLLTDHAMPNPADHSLRPPHAPVTPPTLPPHFPDIPQNLSSELQPAAPHSATPDEVAGTTLDPAESEVQKVLATPTGRHSTPV